MPRRPYAFGWDSKLRKTDEFSSVFRFKRVRRGNSLDIFFCQNGLSYSRLGLIVPKKVWARAVDRNRVKRLLRESFRLSQQDLMGLDVVIRIKALDQDAEYRGQWQAFMRKWSTEHSSAPEQLTNG